MDEALGARFEGFECNEGASPEAVAEVEEVFGRKLPNQLREVLLEADGLNGVIGGHELQIWSTKQIVAFNRANEVQKYSPAFLMFGSDGGGETYTLDYRTNPPSVVLVAAIGFDYGSAIPIGHDFVSFLDRMKDTRSLFDR
jgi:cell wall assembly regulator SMI1